MTAYPPLSQHVHINQIAQGATYNPPSCNHSRRDEVHTPCTDTEESDCSCSSSHHCYSSSRKTNTATRCTCDGYAKYVLLDPVRLAQPALNPIPNSYLTVLYSPPSRSYRVKDYRHHECECESSSEEHSHTHHSCSCSMEKKTKRHHYHSHSRHTHGHTHHTSQSSAGYGRKGRAVDFECACESCSESSSCSESYTHRHAHESHRDVQHMRRAPVARKNVRRGVFRRGRCACEEDEMHCAYGPPLMVVDVGRGRECCSYH